jgi:DNA-binding Lrp family transcriptional regulator
LEKLDYLVFLEQCMKLTRRQEEFVNNLIDLSLEFDGPIHYSILAERLGVSPFTAYDMLCLLEDKGLVTSEYQLAEDKQGPGRAERLFYPYLSSERREELENQFGGQIPGKEERRKLVLEQIQSREFRDKELAAEFLARVPDIEQGELSYCIELMTIVALRMKDGCGRKLLLDYLPGILPGGEPTRENLSMLGGFAFGIVAQECGEDTEWVEKLFVHIQQYFSIVLQLDSQERKQLAGALSGVFDRFSDKSNGR